MSVFAPIDYGLVKSIQIVACKNDPGNGRNIALFCLVQIVIVSDRTGTGNFANNNAQHFAFDTDEWRLPVCQFADEDNAMITQRDESADLFLATCTLGHTIRKCLVSRHSSLA